MLMAYSQDVFPNDYVPTVFDNFTTLIVVDGKTIRLGLWDTAGQEEFHSITRIVIISKDKCHKIYPFIIEQINNSFYHQNMSYIIHLLKVKYS